MTTTGTCLCFLQFVSSHCETCEPAQKRAGTTPWPSSPAIEKKLRPKKRLKRPRKQKQKPKARARKKGPQSRVSVRSSRQRPKGPESRVSVRFSNQRPQHPVPVDHIPPGNKRTGRASGGLGTKATQLHRPRPLRGVQRRITEVILHGPLHKPMTPYVLCVDGCFELAQHSATCAMHGAIVSAFAAMKEMYMVRTMYLFAMDTVSRVRTSFSHHLAALLSKPPGRRRFPWFP